MKACFSCHGRAGILSVNSFTHFFGPPTHSPAIGEGDPEMQYKSTEAEKRQRYDFGLLQGLMRKGD